MYFYIFTPFFYLLFFINQQKKTIQIKHKRLHTALSCESNSCKIRTVRSYRTRCKARYSVFITDFETRFILQLISVWENFTTLTNAFVLNNSGYVIITEKSKFGNSLYFTDF